MGFEQSEHYLLRAFSIYRLGSRRLVQNITYDGLGHPARTGPLSEHRFKSSVCVPFASTPLATRIYIEDQIF
jgi:hypothetical protein